MGMIRTLKIPPGGWGYYDGTSVDICLRLCNNASNAMQVFYELLRDT